ncbi:serine O-acetyltransferase [Buchnera aphidicola (Rhopalosiphum padi)]|uniref:Serine acetyltransferase n=1 Tax=Buchnera aphidicola subsp. Rhopalosiphum padi TaxID=98793 RepID=A0A4D6YFN7_BUCRP|nr:serine O-acetyltransferase [Buchnera aphidicola]QCI24714.1 serine O-acetyltransferase [Buchnera aphidicola (Rhopalosiphum padi)]
MCSLEVLELWNIIKHEAQNVLKKEPVLSKFYQESILNHKKISGSLSYILSNKLSTSMISEKKLYNIFNDIYLNNVFIINSVVKDIKAVLQRDPVVKNYLTPLLYLKGFQALEAYRLSNYLWNMKKYELSTYLQSRISTVFSVDIHPGAFIGSGIMFDHATGIVIGEGVIIENDVSIFHSVTLGGTGKNSGKNRHPTIRKKVTIGAGAKILGNIEVGKGVKVGAGSVVLKNIPPFVTVAGVPAKIIKKNQTSEKNFFQEEKNNLMRNLEFFQYGEGI